MQLCNTTQYWMCVCVHVSEYKTYMHLKAAIYKTNPVKSAWNGATPQYTNVNRFTMILMNIWDVLMLASQTLSRKFCYVKDGLMDHNWIRRLAAVFDASKEFTLSHLDMQH